MLALDLLQSHVIDESIPLSKVMREAYILARELKIDDLEKWTKEELSGYSLDRVVAGQIPDWVPAYRRPESMLWAEGPMGIRKPVQMRNHELEDRITRPVLNHPIGDLEQLAEQAGDNGNVEMTLHALNAAQLAAALPGLRPYLVYPSVSLRGLVRAARQRLLETVMDLRERHADLEEGISPAQAQELLRVDREARASMNPLERMNAFLNTNPWTTRLIAELMAAVYGRSI